MSVVPMSVTALWTPEEAYHHLKGTFDQACKQDPGIMDSYMAMAEAATDRTEEIEIMREGLRKTVAQRYPYTLLPEHRP